MLRSVKDLIGYSIGATDGTIGKVRDFLLDDREWIVRYLVADTGTWLSDQLVILSPAALGRADYGLRMLAVELSSEEVRNSPPIEADQPVSRQREAELAQYYGWPAYWNPAMTTAGGGVFMGPWAVPPLPEAQPADAPDADARERAEGSRGDPHLRSARELIGYHVEATDGEIGHVEDIIIDDDRWSVQYVVVDTRNWWPARKVVMLPMWVSGVSWDLRQVQFDLPKETIRNGPEYNPAAPINEQDETRFYDYYGRPVE